MKNCPFCKEAIQDDAIKCRFCGEFLDKPSVGLKKADSEKTAQGNSKVHSPSGPATKESNSAFEVIFSFFGGLLCAILANGIFYSDKPTFPYRAIVLAVISSLILFSSIISRITKKRKRYSRLAFFIPFVILSTIFFFMGLDNYKSRPIKTKKVTETATEQAKPKPRSIKYQLVKKDDVSYLNTPRMVYRVALDVSALPLKQDMEYTAGLIRKSDTNDWAEFTVFMYLPEMDTGSASYYTAEFEHDKLVRSEVQDFSPYGTKWEPKDEAVDAKSKTAQLDQTQRKKYFINVGVNKLTGRKVSINITTDFPDGTNLLVDVYRIYWQKGKPDEYSGEMLSKDIPVNEGKISIEVLVDDASWVNKYMQDAEKFGKLIDYPGIGKISPNIEVSVLFSPRRDQPPNVLRISGKDGEFVDGSGAEKGKNLTTYRVTVPVDIPYHK